MFSAHSKDNGSPTSVAHKLDQADSVVVRRDELVILGRQDLARDDAGVLDVQLYVSGRKATLLATYADAASQQRSYMRWIETPQAAVSEAIRVTGMYTYGRVELEPRAALPPPGWTELMLAMHHQEPVGRCFQR